VHIGLLTDAVSLTDHFIDFYARGNVTHIVYDVTDGGYANDLAVHVHSYATVQEH